MKLELLTDRIYITLKPFLFVLFGMLIGVTGALSFLRTEWGSYKIDFFFWWSMVSTLIGFVFVCFSIWQFWEGESKREKIKAQVKVWMQDANGITEALKKIIQDNLGHRYSTTNDVCNAVWAVVSSSFALYQSLYEERCVTEEEYRARQKRLADLLETQQLEQIRGEPTNTLPNT